MPAPNALALKVVLLGIAPFSVMFVAFAVPLFLTDNVYVNRSPGIGFVLSTVFAIVMFGIFVKVTDAETYSTFPPPKSMWAVLLMD